MTLIIIVPILMVMAYIIVRLEVRIDKLDAKIQELEKEQPASINQDEMNRLHHIKTGRDPINGDMWSNTGKNIYYVNGKWHSL